MSLGGSSLWVALALFNQQPLSQEQLLNRASALYDRLAGPYTRVGLRVDQGWQEMGDEMFIVSTPSAYIALYRDGTVRGYTFCIQNLDVQEAVERVNATEARRIAIDEFRELWPSFSSISVTRLIADRTPGGPEYTVWFTVEEGNFLFVECGAHVVVNALTGQIMKALGPNLPIRPAWVPPAITTSQAEDTMLSYLQGRAQGRLVIDRPVAHQVWVPGPAEILPSTPVAWRTYQRERRGVLIYTGRWRDLEGPIMFDGLPPIWDVYVDPQSGLVVGAYSSLVGGSFGGGSPVRKPVASQWDLGVGPLTVSYRGRTADVAAGDVADLGFKKPPKDAEPIRLTRGRLVLLATYSRRTGLVYLPSLGRYRAGRPNAALRQVFTSQRWRADDGKAEKQVIRSG
ncbi:MAG: hypothetical protein K1X67_19450 [Fimbriimonadaceae bacterium]|nr:hypothetical protein [Fimbriimonadaceae bacterium]